MRLELYHVRFLKPFEEYVSLFSCAAMLLWLGYDGEMSWAFGVDYERVEKGWEEKKS
jgi:hypothetical protein